MYQVPRAMVAKLMVGSIWLRDTAKQLSLAPTRSGRARQFHGFDISPAHFPTMLESGHEYHVHDLTKPFPTKFRGTFDLVHIRLLSVALKKKEVSKALKNVLALLSMCCHLSMMSIIY